jgi:GT2 family glycosyltransferase
MCLESIRTLIGDSLFEVIVVDNSSTDLSVSEIENNFKFVRVIRNPENIGFIKANNIGIKLATGKYVLSLNNDTIVHPKALEKLVAFMDSHNDVGACGAKLINSDGSIQHQCKRGFPTPWNIFCYSIGLSKLFPKSKLFAGYLLTYLNPEVPAEVDSLSGACFLVRSEVIETVGIMDERFTMYGDDLDWSYRIKQAGWKIFYVPQAVITHFGGKGGSHVNSYRNIVEFHRSMIIFYNLHYRDKYSLFIRWVVYLGVFMKLFSNLFMNAVRANKYVGSKKP